MGTKTEDCLIKCHTGMKQHAFLKQHTYFDLYLLKYRKKSDHTYF